MRSCSASCHLAQLNMPRLVTNQVGQYCIIDLFEYALYKFTLYLLLLIYWIYQLRRNGRLS